MISEQEKKLRAIDEELDRTNEASVRATKLLFNPSNVLCTAILGQPTDYETSLAENKDSNFVLYTGSDSLQKSEKNEVSLIENKENTFLPNINSDHIEDHGIPKTATIRLQRAALTSSKNSILTMNSRIKQLEKQIKLKKVEMRDRNIKIKQLLRNTELLNRELCSSKVTNGKLIAKSKVLEQEKQESVILITKLEKNIKILENKIKDKKRKFVEKANQEMMQNQRETIKTLQNEARCRSKKYVDMESKVISTRQSVRALKQIIVRQQSLISQLKIQTTHLELTKFLKFSEEEYERLVD